VLSTFRDENGDGMDDDGGALMPDRLHILTVRGYSHVVVTARLLRRSSIDARRGQVLLDPSTRALVPMMSTGN